MSIIGKSSTIQLDSILFATDFSPASQNAGLYASVVSVHFGIADADDINIAKEFMERRRKSATKL